MADPFKVSKGAKIRIRYKQVPHLTQHTNEKVANSQLDTTNDSQEVSPFPACDQKAHIKSHCSTLCILDIFLNAGCCLFSISTFSKLYFRNTIRIKTV